MCQTGWAWEEKESETQTAQRQVYRSDWLGVRRERNHDVDSREKGVWIRLGGYEKELETQRGTRKILWVGSVGCEKSKKPRRR